jgi:hypothetical protein
MLPSIIDEHSDKIEILFSSNGTIDEVHLVNQTVITGTLREGR